MTGVQFPDASFALFFPCCLDLWLLHKKGFRLLRCREQQTTQRRIYYLCRREKNKIRWLSQDRSPLCPLNSHVPLDPQHASEKHLVRHAAGGTRPRRDRPVVLQERIGAKKKTENMNKRQKRRLKTGTTEIGRECAPNANIARNTDAIKIREKKKKRETKIIWSSRGYLMQHEARPCTAQKHCGFCCRCAG